MNKNTRQRKAIAAKANKGNWPVPVFKAKKKKFAEMGEPMSLADQRKFFHNYI